VRCLEVGISSVDFGRSGVVQVLGSAQDASFSARVKSMKSKLWREGAITREFPFLKPVLLTMLEAAHTLQGVSVRLRR
jgi:hypothetical protein